MIGNIFSIILLTLFVIGVIGFCYQESKNRKIHFVFALLICICLTPFIGYFIISNIGLRHTLTCLNCGNTKSERSKCGVCGNEIVALDK
jgi:hypothetical protein